MATIQAPFIATNTGTVLASDRYEVTAANTVFTAASATAPSSFAWNYGSGKVTISTDVYTNAGTYNNLYTNYNNTAPDTLAIKFVAPYNLITNQWGGLADNQAALFPSMQPVTLAWKGITTNTYIAAANTTSTTTTSAPYIFQPSQTTFSTTEDLNLALIDYRSLTNPANSPASLTFIGFDKYSDKIVLENYLSSLGSSSVQTANAIPYDSQSIGLRTGSAGIVQSNCTIDPTPTTVSQVGVQPAKTAFQSITQTGTYQWVLADDLQPNSNLTAVNYNHEQILSASVFQLSNANVINTAPTAAGFVSYPGATDLANLQNGMATFRGDLQAEVLRLLPGGSLLTPQQIPNTRWNDLKIQLNFTDNAFNTNSTNLDLGNSTPTLILDGAYQLGDSTGTKYFSQNNYTPPTLDVTTIGTQYTIFLDPNAKNSQSIAIENKHNYTPDNNASDIVSYSNWGINFAGNFDIVEAGTGALTSTSFSSSTQGATLTFSNDVTTVLRPNQGVGSASVTDKFSGIEGFFLTTGKDTFNIDTTLSPSVSNGLFSGTLSTGSNTGDVGNSYFVMGGLGVDTYNIKTSATPQLNAADNDVSSIKDLGILLSDGAKENSGVVYNLGASAITYGSTVTSTSLNNDGTAKFQLKDGYGNVEDLNFATNAYVDTIWTQGTSFRDIYSITDNGGRGHYSNLYVQASRGNDSVNEDQDLVWSAGVSGAVNYSNNPSALKAVGITMDYSNFGDLAPLKTQAGDNWVNNKLLESARVDSGLYAFSSTIWKAGYGMDNYQTGSTDSYNDVTLKFTDQSDYAEFDNPRVNTDDLNLQMGGGKDLVYLNLPWISNTGALNTQQAAFDNASNKKIDVELGWHGSDNNQHGDGLKDQLQIDLTNIEKHFSTLQVKEVNVDGFDFGLDKLSFVTGNARLDSTLSSLSSTYSTSNTLGSLLAGQTSLTTTAGNNQIVISKGANDSQLSISYVDVNGTSTQAIKINFTNSSSNGSGIFTADGVSGIANSLQFVSDRSIAQYAPVYMTDNADSAILNENSGFAGPGLGIYDFKGGDDLVTLYKGDLDVALGAGNDTARVNGTSGNSIIIGGGGIDTLYLNGLQSQWNFSVLTTTQATQMLADKYGVAATATNYNQFGIEQDAAGLNVVMVGKRSPSLLDPSYAEFDQTIVFQAETVGFDDATKSSDTLMGSFNYSMDLSKVADRTISQTFYGRRGTDSDSITITTDSAGVMAGLKNIRALIDTGVDITSATKDTAALSISTKLAGSVLEGSSVNKLNLSQIKSDTNTTSDYFVDIEKIVLTDGTAANTFTIRLAGSNGYSSVDAAMDASNFGDIIYVADTIESVLNSKGSQAVSTVNNVTIKSGLGIAFEAAAPSVTTQTAFDVTVSESKANLLAGGIDVANIPGFGIGSGVTSGQVGITAETRVTYLLGDNKINVQGSGLNDVIIGNRGDNILRGGGGDDILFGGAGADVLLGQTGDDTLIGSDKDYLNAGSGNDTLYAMGATRTTTTGTTPVTTVDTQVLIAGAGNDKVVLHKNNSGQVNVFLGSGNDELVVSDDWFSSFSANKTGTGTTTAYAQSSANDPVAKILDFATTADKMSSVNYAAKTSDADIDKDLSKVGITIQQLVSPPNPVDGAHDYLTAANNSSIENIDFNGTGLSTASVAELVNAYKLVNG